MGGIATAHFNIHSALSKAGWQVKAFAYDDVRDAESASEVRRIAPGFLITSARACCNLVLAILSPFRQRFQLFETLRGALAGLRLREPLECFRPDVILVPDKGCPLIFLRKPEGARLIWIAHHNPMRFLAPEAGLALSELDAKLAVALESRGLRKADLVLCPSNYMREQFLATYRFDGPVELFPNLISDEVEQDRKVTPPLRQLLGLEDSAPLFCLPGAGTSVKGGRFLAPLLAEIGRRHAQAGVFISGNVEDEHLAAALQPPPNVRVHSSGFLPYAENLARVRECDVVLSPALMENFSMALLEASWLGLPVAAFSAGGNPELICTTDAGTNGITVPVGDLRMLCDAGDRLLRKLRDGELSRQQVERYTRSRFSTAQALVRLEALIRSLAVPAGSVQ